MTHTIPHQEDLPLILAWIKPCTDPHQGCKRHQCTRPAAFLIEEYEDKRLIEEAFERGGIIDMTALEDTIWQHTMREQMVGNYVVHQVDYSCKEHQLYWLAQFLNTKEKQELAVVLDGVRRGDYTLIQWHRLSNPELGLCALVKPEITTPQQFVALDRQEHTPAWHLGKGETTL